MASLKTRSYHDACVCMYVFNMFQPTSPTHIPPSHIHPVINSIQFLYPSTAHPHPRWFHSSQHHTQRRTKAKHGTATLDAYINNLNTCAYIDVYISPCLCVYNCTILYTYFCRCIQTAQATSKLLVRNMFNGLRSRWMMGCDRPWRYANASPVFNAQRIAKLKCGLKTPSTEEVLCLSM